MTQALPKDEEELLQRQDAALYPLGRALRSTYDAENHDSLDSTVTGLMIDLSKVPFEPCAIQPPAPPALPPLASPEPVVRRSLLSRVRDLLVR